MSGPGLAEDGAGGGEGEAGPPAIVPLALLDGYKVRWNRKTVARDVVQNFFDAAADFDDVTIEAEGDGRIRVEGPATFALDYLRYIGATSKRDARAAGGFGEGFKICALVLLRDYGVELRAGSGVWEIRPFFRPMKLGRELCYEVVSRPPGSAPAGSWVEITGADDELCDAFEESRDWFRHEHNPLLARPLHVDEAAGVGVFFARDARRGDVFYRRQHRGVVAFPKGAGLTFASDDRVEGVEADRDRRGIRAPARVVAGVIARLPTEVIERIVRHLRPYWQDGNAVLDAALREARRRGARLAFTSRWIAAGSSDHRLMAHARRRGCLIALAAFAGVGMPTAAERFGELDLPRPPTPLERARVDVALDLYAVLLGEPAPARPVQVREIAGAAFLLGARRAVEIAAATLAAPFDDGIGDVLSALARQEGPARLHDASRLTYLIEGVLREAGRLDAFRARWEQPGELPPPMDEDDEPIERRPGAPVVRVAILAPRGFPPADEIARRIARAARRLRVDLHLDRVDVEGPEAAARQYARGIPSVWIDDVEIEPPGGRARYEVRTFAGPDGPSLCPGADVLQATLTAITARATGRRSYRYPMKRLRRGRDAHRGWLQANRPEAYLAELEGDVLSALIDSAREKSPRPGDEALYGMGQFAHFAARRSLREIGAHLKDDARWSAVREEIARAFDVYRAMATALGEAARDVAPEDDEGAVVGHLLGQAGALVHDTALAEIAERIVPLADPLARLHAAARALPLDTVCQISCMEAARQVLFARADEGPTFAALAAQARLQAAAGIAEERHAKVEAVQSLCLSLRETLLARFAERTRGRGSKEEDQVAERVRAVFREAVAAGLPELDAARRGLEVATVAAEEERARCEKREKREKRERAATRARARRQGQ